MMIDWADTTTYYRGILEAKEEEIIHLLGVVEDHCTDEEWAEIQTIGDDVSPDDLYKCNDIYEMEELVEKFDSIIEELREF